MTILIIFYPLGVAVLVLGLSDVFFSVLAYDSAGPLVERAYRLTWRAIRALAGLMPSDIAAFVRSVGAPVMVVLSVIVWIVLPVLGFALLYYPGISGGSFRLHGVGNSFLTSVYFSAATISSLSFSGIEPANLGLYLLSAAETLIGLGILTLVVTYVLGLYATVQGAAAAWVNLQHHANGVGHPPNLLTPHFSGGTTEGLSTLWRDLHHNLTSYLEGMRRYPLVYYFYTRNSSRSLPYMFWFIGEAASAVRWGLPTGHPATTDPWLPGLVEGYRSAMEEIEATFMTTKIPPAAVGVDLAVFVAAREVGHSDVESVDDFFTLERFLADTAKVPPSDNPSEAYVRYCQWWKLTGGGRAFVQAVGEDFGVTVGKGPSVADWGDARFRRARPSDGAGETPLDG